MCPEEYKALQTQLLAFASVVKDWDLMSFLQAIEHAEAVGPFLDPTSYMQGAKNMADIKRLAEGLLPFQRAIQEVLERIPR